MRHKLRLCLLILLTTCSVFSSALWLGSTVYMLTLNFVHLQIIVESGGVSVYGDRTDGGQSVNAKPVRTAVADRWRSFVAYGIRGFTLSFDPPFSVFVALPLWFPSIAFGLWPGIFVIKSMRRRRRMARGFEVSTQ